MIPPFVHLQVRSEYSLSDSIIRINPLLERVAELDMPAIAITDRCNLFAAAKFYQAALTYAIKPIIGVDMELRPLHTELPPGRLLLLSQNKAGLQSLMRLITRAYTEGQESGKPLLVAEWLDGESENLIAISPGLSGDVDVLLRHSNDEQRVRERLKYWRNVFGDRFYLGVQRTARQDDEWAPITADLSIREALPLVATNDVCFLHSKQFEVHEARVCINQGAMLHDAQRPQLYSKQQYLRSAKEMLTCFEQWPEALQNSVEIARRCSTSMDFKQRLVPSFPTPRGTSEETLLKQQVDNGLVQRLAAKQRTHPDQPLDIALKEKYQARLAYEMAIICNMGFSGYFLIVADFIAWAQCHAIPVGPGRGSGGGSLVAWTLGITTPDPIQHDLLFERFLNPERVSMPDFDIDLCMDRREQVIQYITPKYGRQNVAQIINFGTMAARAAVRDVGRILGQPYNYVDQLAKLIPPDLGITLEAALQKDPLKARYEEDEESATIINLARQLEGLVRNVGKHASGIVISPQPLTCYTAMYREPSASSALTTQFDKDDLENIGLLKFDLLGLRTLTIIDTTMRSINARRTASGTAGLSLDAIDTADPKVYDSFKSGSTTAVFQLESRGMQELVHRLQPHNFDDIIALLALYRPGPLGSGMDDEFIRGKQGHAVNSYLHPTLEPILKSTYGVILYQEQVMHIAQVLAGYSLGSADLLRRAMGKKKPEEMAALRDGFVDGAIGNGVSKHIAAIIFDQIEKFAGYGFNKSHATAYALLSYQTAWLKYYYPADFMAAALTGDMNNTDKVVTLINACRNLGLDLQPPNVNRCERSFNASNEHCIDYGLAAIKGVGGSIAESLVADRKAHGDYQDLFDLCNRLGSKRINRRSLEALICAGACDQLGPSRSVMWASAPSALQYAEERMRDRLSGQSDLFAVASEHQRPQFATAPAWSEEERLAKERSMLGMYLSGHPIQRHEDELSKLGCARLDHIPACANNQIVWIAGFVDSIRTIRTKNKGRMAFLQLSDSTAQAEVNVRHDLYSKQLGLIQRDHLLVAECKVTADDYTAQRSIVAVRLYDLEQACTVRTRHLKLKLAATNVTDEFCNRLFQLIESHPGRAPLYLYYQATYTTTILIADERFSVTPNRKLLDQLRALLGEQAVVLEY